MGKSPIEFSNYVGPDSIRQTFHLLNNMYDLHTKRFYGYEDINGSQYVGTVENWGSELLLESRKLSLDRPSLKNIFIENTFDFYFNIEYSGFTNTYDQENLLCAVLKKNTLLSNTSYRIKFKNVFDVEVVRSQSSSDSTVYIDKFVCSLESPILIIDDGDTVNEVPLKLTDVDGNETKYYFHIGNDTSDMIDDDSIDENGDLTTLPITDDMFGRACVWMYTNKLQILPRVNIYGNDYDDKKFLTIGTDGHDKTYLYPLINFMIGDIDPNYYVKIIPIDNSYFVNDIKNTNNYKVSIKEIQVVDKNNEASPILSITYDDEFVKMYLAKSVPWEFKPMENESNNTRSIESENIKELEHLKDIRDVKCYAYVKLDKFDNNMRGVNKPKTEMLFLHFDEDLFTHDYEWLDINVYSGIHVDLGPDYSDNGVSKKNGVIHDLGDFDGLPDHFKSFDNNNRAILESYVIRDSINKRNPTVMDKHAAGIILDSGTYIESVSSNSNIVYDKSNMSYHTIPKIQDQMNVVTDITVSGDGLLGNINIRKYMNDPRLIYHGDGTFSIGKKMNNSEIGRAYIISNDEAAYVNNACLPDEEKKPDRTFARICDIPTDFTQLTNIKGIAPTVVIDKDYIRTECNFTTNYKDIVYNSKNKIKLLQYLNDSMVWPSYINIEREDVKATMDEKYPRYVNLNDKIDISNDSITFSIANGASGKDYKVDDTFIMYIGGISTRGIVTGVDSSGVVTSIAFLPNNTTRPTFSESKIARSNLAARETSYITTTTSGNGTGLTITMSIPENIWNVTEMKPSTIYPKYVSDVFALYQDDFKNIWVYTFDETTNKLVVEEQLSGADVYKNINDMDKNTEDYGFKDVFLINILNQETYTTSSNTDIPYTKYNIRRSIIDKNDDRIHEDIDMSDYLNSDSINEQDSIFAFVDGSGTSQHKHALIYSWGYINNDKNNIQVYQDLNVHGYTNKSNKIRFVNIPNSQPELLIFDPYESNIIKYDNIEKDVMKVSDTKPFSLVDLLSINDNGIVTKDASGNDILTTNIYIYDEFNDTDIIAKRESYESMTRQSLINKIKDVYPNATLLKYEDTSKAYTKEMLVDFLMENDHLLNRTAGNPGFEYTEGPESLYRRPTVKLFRHKDEIISSRNKPVGDQPSGAYKNISSEVFDGTVKIDNTKYTSTPWNVFRIDTDEEEINLKGFRLYDELNNDISKSSILIINGVLYAPLIKNNNIDWVIVNRK